MNINYPVSVSNSKDKYVYLYRLQELLKLEHNEIGKQFRENKITEKQWLSYKNDCFDSKSLLISNEICKYRELLKNDTKSIAKLSDIVE